MWNSLYKIEKKMLKMIEFKQETSKKYENVWWLERNAKNKKWR